MNCERCQELLSEFLDDSLNFAERSEIEAHLQECTACFAAHEELVSILNVCDTYTDEYDSPPNPQALWLRISNLIESEQLTNAANVKQLSEGKRESRWSRLGKRTWQISLPQLMSGMVAVAVVVALFMTVALRGVSDRSGNEAFKPFGSDSTGIAATYSGSVEDRIKQQQQVIDYWNQRIEQRKAQWDRKTREAFERQLRALDEAMAQYRDALMQNPHDEVYREALDSVLEDKVALLRDFSAL